MIVEPYGDAHPPPGLHAVLDAVARGRLYLAFEEAPPLEEMRRFAAYGAATGSPRFVAVEDGRVTGWCDITRTARPAHRHRGVLGMGLLPVFRGRGTGRTLIEATMRAARKAGFARIELTVFADNRPALALYGTMGFEREGLLRGASLVGGRRRDEVMMVIAGLWGLPV